MTTFDDPNREAVGLEPAWVEGEGGSTDPEPGHPEGFPEGASEYAVTDEDRKADLDAMTKDELLAFAQRIGVKPANAAMTKDDLRAGVDARLGGS
jgi:hypothetical protein